MFSMSQDESSLNKSLVLISFSKGCKREDMEKKTAIRDEIMLCYNEFSHFLERMRFEGRMLSVGL